MASEKITRLIESLVRKTAAGTLRWEKASVPDFFQASFPRYSVLAGWKSRGSGFENEFARAMRGVDNSPFVLRIGGEEGHIIEEVDATEAPDLPELFAMARRNASGVEQALDDIIGYLEEKKQSVYGGCAIWRENSSATVSMVSASAGDLSSRSRTIRAKRKAIPDSYCGLRWMSP